LELRDLRVLVTGAANGAGTAIVDRFLAAGARVHVADIDAAAVSNLKNGRAGLSASVRDCGCADAVRMLFDEVSAELGGLDVLINNVGIAGPTAVTEEVTPEDWDRTIAVNLSGFFYCTRLAIPLLKQAGGGTILNVSSTTARSGLPLRLPYAVSKVGVLGLTDTLARELGPFNIWVNSILPGWINNERGNAVLARKAAVTGIPVATLKSEGLEFISMRTQIEPEEIADMMAFLCSAKARHVSGQHIGVCGNAEYER
jgi:NAD(P)-dependent dehydrogenase (short-subunit alcohol dehydrogenase family)